MRSVQWELTHTSDPANTWLYSARHYNTKSENRFFLFFFFASCWVLILVVFYDFDSTFSPLPIIAYYSPHLSPILLVLPHTHSSNIISTVVTFAYTKIQRGKRNESVFPCTAGSAICITSIRPFQKWISPHPKNTENTKLLLQLGVGGTKMTFLIILGREYGVGFSRFEHISAWEQSLSNWLTTLPLRDVYCFIVLKSC